MPLLYNWPTFESFIQMNWDAEKKKTDFKTFVCIFKKCSTRGEFLLACRGLHHTGC